MGMTVFAVSAVFLLTLSVAFNSPFGYVLGLIMIISGIAVSLSKGRKNRKK